ncbi:MAG: hypothetical protein Q4B40_01190 [Clostridia bacterium]|nr:hypothetical protein [Clostridia bacterium]
MFKKIFALVLVIVMIVGMVGCGDKNKLPEYENHEFEISAFWAPYDISEKGLQQYKDAGFNTLAMINHSLDKDSDNQFYLGSNRTMTALKNCKKVGLKAILNYNDWIATWAENDENYYSETPFSQYDVYGEYKDIIVGIHIVDEPKQEHIDRFSDKAFIDDFKKTYPNAKYIVNLIPEYASASAYDFDTYEDMWDIYNKEILSKFETNRISSLDFYYFYARDNGKRKVGIMKNFDQFAKFAKNNNTSQTFIMQSSVTNEFDSTLSEGDIRLQANMSMAFGADAMQYYCYSVPFSINEDDEKEYMYDYCIMTQDDKPSDVYNHVKKVNAEAQALAPAILSYKWQEATAVPGISNVMQVGEYYDMSDGKFEKTKHYKNVQGTENVVMSRFTSDKYGEAYMLVNFAERELDNTVDLIMKECETLAIYGGVGFNGTPKIVELDKDGKCQINLAYGEGVFIVPLK